MENKKVQKKDFKHIITLIQTAQQKVYAKINQDLVLLYWNVGNYVFKKISNGKWGDAVVEELAKYIMHYFPNLKGFNKRGLYRMKQFYETYHQVKNIRKVLTEISWSNHLSILSKCPTLEEKQFYIGLASKEKWSNRILVRQIESSVYERTMLSNQNVSTALTQYMSTVLTQLPKTNQPFKDTYVFEFLDLPETYQEKDLQNQLVSNIKKFLMELGRGFTFVGEEYRIQVGMHDYYIDLLLYHRELQCLVVIELKVTEFTPEHLGKMNFYLEALDKNVKLPNENPSIGILICKSKDKEVVEFALNRSLSPTMVADYKTKLIDKTQLQKKVSELYELLYKNETDGK